MKINLSGHHVDISDAVREHVDEKLSKIAGHFPSLISIDAIVAKEHGEYMVELITNYEGVKIATKGVDAVMYPAISKAAKKFDTALKHRKGQLKEDLHKKPVVSSPAIAHETIQNMNLN